MAVESTASIEVAVHQRTPIPLEARFECRPGELLALVGPSGSGKSTILRCIAGLHTPEQGRVRCGADCWLDSGAGVNLAPQRRKVGLVFQSYVLFPHLSALDNVALPLGRLPREARVRRARELIKLVRLEGLEARRPDELSGGQQQRVALARALARDPSVLLLDEPFSAVDQVTRRKLQHELARLHNQLNLPTILVTHDLEEACLLAGRMCILHHGTTLQIGPPLEVTARPCSALVARLVGLTNVFRGRVLAQRPEAGHTLLTWQDRALECRHAPQFVPGDTVDWVIPPQNILLHQRVRPSRGERENPLRGVISDFIVLGDSASVTMAPQGLSETPLSFTVPAHVATRNRLAAGEQIGVSLLADAIHLMAPAEATADAG